MTITTSKKRAAYKKNTGTKIEGTANHTTAGYLPKEARKTYLAYCYDLIHFFFFLLNTLIIHSIIDNHD